MGLLFSTKNKGNNENNSDGIINNKLVIGKYDYVPVDCNGISFKKNDEMQILNEIDELWYEVIKTKTKKQGLIPINYLTKQNGSPQSIDGWLDIERWEAEKLLMQNGLDKGTYLIRPSKKKINYIISVRKYDTNKNVYTIKHFQIKEVNKDKQRLYSFDTQTFPSMQEMIQHYKADGIGKRKILLTNSFIDDYIPPIHSTDMNIKQENISIISEIGRCSFGPIYKALWGESYSVIVKLIPIARIERQQFADNIRILNKLRHRKIVEVLGVCTEPKHLPVAIVFENVNIVSMNDFLQSSDGIQLNLLKMIEMMADIAEGMAYLEKEKFVHGDLRAENVSVSSNLTMKVSNFGIRNMINQTQKDEEGQKWFAPELVNRTNFTSKSDVWSFGIVIYEILTRAKSPYPGIPVNEVLDKVIAGYRMENPKFYFTGVCCPCQIYEIMLNCWHEKPDLRPSFLSLKNKMDTMIVKETFKSYYYNTNSTIYCNN